MYYATGYIGRDFTPGEILPDGLPEGFIARLLKSGMIIEEKEAQPKQAHEAGNTENNARDEAKDEQNQAEESEELIAPDMREAQPDARDIAAEYELDMEAEPIEIDVTEGIVTENAAARQTKKRRGGRGK